MNWAFLFAFTSALAVAGWAMLALLPRGPKSGAIILYGCVAILCLIHAALFMSMFSRLVDPGAVSSGSGAGSFTSVAGIRGLFASDGSIVIGWTHYLAFDLFVGLWIAKDADHKGFSRLVQFPFLVATMIAGPVGLLLWLVTREARARRVARDG